MVERIYEKDKKKIKQYITEYVKDVDRDNKRKMSLYVSYDSVKHFIC